MKWLRRIFGNDRKELKIQANKPFQQSVESYHLTSKSSDVDLSKELSQTESNLLKDSTKKCYFVVKRTFSQLNFPSNFFLQTDLDLSHFNSLISPLNLTFSPFPLFRLNFNCPAHAKVLPNTIQLNYKFSKNQKNSYPLFLQQFSPFHWGSRNFSWRNPKPPTTLKRMRSGKKRKYKMKPLGSLKRRFFLDTRLRLLKHKSPGLRHNNWIKSNRKFRRMKRWQYCTRRQTKKYLRFMYP